MGRSPFARRTPFEARFTEVFGLRLRYIDLRPKEEEGPPLLLLHGHASRIEEYDDLVPHLLSGRRIIVFDLPGCGFSDKPDDRSYTLEFYQDVTLALLEHLGIRWGDVGGGSLGGNLTLRLAAREPERFRRLVAWAPAGAWKPMWHWVLVAAFLRRFPSLFWPAIWIQSRFWYSRDWAGREEALKDAFRYYREVFCPGFFRMYCEVGQDQARTSLFDITAKIRQPVLLAWGDRDHALGMGKGVRLLHERLPHSRLHIFPNASHSLANERPRELAAAIDQFLREPDPVARASFLDQHNQAER
ncbi:MAG: alpha/beta hydrolase [Sandaracinaceae bacterium]|nr:alpha/beta hydrolase [Sandaracinaceae bacterium]